MGRSPGMCCRRLLPKCSLPPDLPIPDLILTATIIVMGRIFVIIFKSMTLESEGSLVMTFMVISILNIVGKVCMVDFCTLLADPVTSEKYDHLSELMADFGELSTRVCGVAWSLL